MEEGGASGSGSGGGGGGESARVSTSYMAAGGRQRFEVELRPGETTIVSWKKLVKDANKAVKDANKAAKGKATAMEVPSVPQSAMESRVAPVSYLMICLCSLLRTFKLVSCQFKFGNYLLIVI